jgi:putative membrane protein
MRHSTTTLLALGLCAVALGAAAQERRSPAPAPTSPQTQTVQGADAEFLVDALRSHRLEAQLGELALQRSAAAELREFGRTLQADHAQAADEIELLLEPLNMSVPTEPSAEQHRHYSALANLSGKEFDRAFVPLMVAAHRDAIAHYEAQTRAHGEQQVAELVAKHLPVLRAHLATAESLEP